MADKFAYLGRVDRHIAGAKDRVVRQRQVIARLTADGHDVRASEAFLSALLQMLSVFERHRLLILRLR